MKEEGLMDAIVGVGAVTMSGSELEEPPLLVTNTFDCPAPSVDNWFAVRAKASWVWDRMVGAKEIEPTCTVKFVPAKKLEPVTVKLGFVPNTTVFGLRFMIVGPGMVMLNPPLVPPVLCDNAIVVAPGPSATVLAAEREKEMVLGETLTLTTGFVIGMEALTELIVTPTFDAKFVPDITMLLVVLYWIVPGEILLMDGGPVGVGGAIVNDWIPVLVVEIPLVATICQK